MTAHDIAIVGAGIVGLATGLKLLERQPDLRLAILDKEGAVAEYQTGHNSGVIHGGLYSCLPHPLSYVAKAAVPGRADPRSSGPRPHFLADAVNGRRSRLPASLAA